MRSRSVLVLVALLGASVLCIGLLEVRIRETGDDYYRFLVWNLFLAWVPLAFAVPAYFRARRGIGPLVVLLLILWLLFFPNAPYLLTDFIHLQEGPAPLWYDALMLSAFAWTALLTGFASLYLVQLILRTAFGAVIAWLCVLVVLALSSFGVYIGRFIRFNSWDAVLHPRNVVEVVHARIIAEPPEMAQALAGLTAFLGVAYLVVYSLANLQPGLDERG